MANNAIMRQSRLIGSTIMVLIVAFSWIGFGQETGKPNFIVILCDNHGYGDIEPYWEYPE